MVKLYKSSLTNGNAYFLKIACHINYLVECLMRTSIYKILRITGVGALCLEFVNGETLVDSGSSRLYTNRSNLEIEQKYLTKSGIYLNPDIILRTKNDKRVL